MKPIRILVVEDQAVVRDGIVTVLNTQPDVLVVGQAIDGLQAEELVKETNPDVILLDLAMPRQDGITTIPKILEINPAARILILTSFSDSEHVYQAIKAGAIGYLLKDVTREQLMQAIFDVSTGQPSLPPSIAMKVIQEINHPTQVTYTDDPLTPRELETLRLIARGLSNSEIAAKMFVHERTVAKYVSHILDKLHLANRTQAALYALDKGLTSSEAD